MFTAFILLAELKGLHKGKSQIAEGKIVAKHGNIISWWRSLSQCLFLAKNDQFYLEIFGFVFTWLLS